MSLRKWRTVRKGCSAGNEMEGGGPPAEPQLLSDNEAQLMDSFFDTVANDSSFLYDMTAQASPATTAAAAAATTAAASLATPDWSHFFGPHQLPLVPHTGLYFASAATLPDFRLERNHQRIRREVEETEGNSAAPVIDSLQILSHAATPIHQQQQSTLSPSPSPSSTPSSVHSSTPLPAILPPPPLTTTTRAPRTNGRKTVPNTIKKLNIAERIAQQRRKRRDNLSEEQKRANHIYSEQRRRDLIKDGFADLTEMVPELRGTGLSKSSILAATARFIEDVVRDNEMLRQML